MREYFTKRFPLALLGIFCIVNILGFYEYSNYSVLNIDFYLLFLIYLGLYLHIRILDDFKDYDYDSQNHTDRPLQTGTVNKRFLIQVGIINFFIISTISIIVSYRTNWNHLLFIALTLIYTIPMYYEFGIKHFFQKSPTGVLFTHNLVLVLLFIFFLEIIQHPQGILSSDVLSKIAILLVPNLLIEIGRKVKPRIDHITGKETNDTYNYFWGGGNTILVSMFLIMFSCVLIIIIQQNSVVLVITSILLISSIGIGIVKEQVAKSYMNYVFPFLGIVSLLIPVLTFFGT